MCIYIYILIYLFIHTNNNTHTNKCALTTASPAAAPLRGGIRNGRDPSSAGEYHGSLYICMYVYMENLSNVYIYIYREREIYAHV